VRQVALFAHIMSLEARKRMSYRVDFWINTLIGFVAEFGVYFALTWALFAESGSATIGGLARADMVVYFIAVLLIAKIVRGPAFGGIASQDIYEGHLTKYLIFPTHYVAFKYAEHVGALLPLFVQAVLFGLLGWWLLEPPQAYGISVGTVLAGLVAIAFANLLFFSMRLPLEFVAFWQDNVWSLSVALRFVTNLLGGVMIPLALFPTWSQEMTRWLPFRLLFDWPTRTLLGQVGPTEFVTSLMLAVGWIVVIGSIARVVWRRGSLQYTGVGI